MGFNKFEKKLHRACASGGIDTALWCLSVGADMDSVDALGRTAAHKAALEGKLECLAALLDAGANPNVSDRLGRTPLVAAAENGQRGCVELLAPCSELGARDKMGNNAYLAAATSWRLNEGDSFDWVIRLGAETGGGLSDSDHFKSMRAAAKKGCIGMLAALVRPGDDQGPYRIARRISLMAAAENGLVGCIELLINESDFDARGLDPRDTWAQRAKERAWNWGHDAAAKSIDAFGRMVAERDGLAVEIGAFGDPVASEPHGSESSQIRRQARL